METEVEIILPVYIVGDNRSLPYRNIVFREKWNGAWVMARTKYIPDLTAYDFFDQSTRDFHPEFIQFLEYEGLVRAGRCTHLSNDPIDFDIAQATAQPVRPPLILIAVGNADVKEIIVRLLNEVRDFAPPIPTDLPLRDGSPIPWDTVDDAIEDRVRPLISGLEQLIAAGFNRIYVQAVAPPHQDACRKETSRFGCTATVHSKLIQAFNRKLADKVHSIGLTFLDRWPDLSDNGVLRSEFDIDGRHMPPKAAIIYLEALIDDAINSRGRLANHPRHELYYRMACGLGPFQTTKPGTV